ncbi:MAG: creatininase family protein [Caldilineales bacterium]|nr:creatininase family protein [Caldilineales bacterium]
MHLHRLLPHQFRQAIDEKWPLLAPTGCIEYHGPHLPLGVDTMIVEELLARVSKRMPCIVAPPLWYGPASYAVSGPELGSLDVSTERFGRHVKDVLAGFWDMGFRWIIVGVHHQGLDGPESLAIRQAAAEVMFERSYAERGKAWWGKAPLEAQDNVFERIQVWPSVLPEAAAQKIEMGDHAGFYETSYILAAHPELVDLNKLGMNPPWYTNTSTSRAREATAQAGERMLGIMADAWVSRLSAMTRPKRPSPNEVTVSGLF